MKTKTLKSFTLKAILILTWTVVGFSDFSKCHAQSIVGKWNQVSSKQFLTAEGAKTHGTPVLETQMSTIGSVEFEFKSNHTYVERSSSLYDSKIRTLTGIWSISGNKLEMKLDPTQEDPKYNPKKDAISPNTTLSINGNTMVCNTFYPDSKIISKIELTLTRM